MLKRLFKTITIRSLLSTFSMNHMKITTKFMIIAYR